MSESIDVEKLQIGQATHPGEVGKNNEDDSAWFVLPLPGEGDRKALVAVVADGIGGNRGGEEASRTAVQAVKDHCVRRGLSNPLQDLTLGIREANRRVYLRAQESELWAGMGTTVAAVAVVDGKLYMANVGDSRIYLIRNGAATQLSIDHTWAQEQIDAGQMKREQAMRHPNRNVLKRYLGIQSEVDVDVRMRLPQQEEGEQWNQPLELERGDHVLLCSDGLSDLVSDHDIATTVTRSTTAQRAADRLVDMARARGGYDNITVLDVAVPGGRSRGRVGGARLLAIVAGVLLLAATAAAVYWFVLRPAQAPSESPAARPTATALVSMVPSETSEATLESPGVMATVLTGTRMPTPTALPTASATPLPEMSGILTPTMTTAPTAELLSTIAPTMTPTRPLATRAQPGERALSAVVLVEPIDSPDGTGRSRFVGEQEVVFRWEWDGQLADEQWFDVAFRREDTGQTKFLHAKHSSVTLTEPPLGWAKYEWWVRVGEFKGNPEEDGSFIAHLTPDSQHWHFRWDDVGKPPENPLATQTPRPTEPPPPTQPPPP